MKNLLKHRIVHVTAAIGLSFCLLYLFAFNCSKIYAEEGDCCAQCDNYCHCDAVCGSSCTAYECANKKDECPGVGTRCCLCDDPPD